MWSKHITNLKISFIYHIYKPTHDYNCAAIWNFIDEKILLFLLMWMMWMIWKALVFMEMVPRLLTPSQGMVSHLFLFFKMSAQAFRNIWYEKVIEEKMPHEPWHNISLQPRVSQPVPGDTLLLKLSPQSVELVTQSLLHLMWQHQSTEKPWSLYRASFQGEDFHLGLVVFQSLSLNMIRQYLDFVLRTEWFWVRGFVGLMLSWSKIEWLYLALV